MTCAKISAGLALLTLIVFFSVVTHDFINYDTQAYLHNNPNVRTGLSFANVQWAFTSFQISNWHPVTWLSHMLDVSLFGLNPAGHHATNLLFHTINVVLLFQILFIMTGERWPAVFIAAIFAVHPAHVESVAWVAERKDVLSTFFLLLTIYAYRHYTIEPSRWRYGLVVLLFALGLMAKPMLVTLPFVLLLLDYWPLGRLADTGSNQKPVLRRAGMLVYEKLPLLLLSLGSAILTFYAQQSGGAMDHGAKINLLDRIGNAIVAYGHYIKTAVVPAELALYYPHPGTWPPTIIWANLGLLGVISTASIIWIRRYPWFFTGWAFFLGTLVPVIGIVQVGDQAYADRYTYVPYIGLFIALIFGVREIYVRYGISKTILNCGAVSLLILYSIVSIQYLGHWQNSITIWTRTLMVTDEDYPVIVGLEEGTVDRSRRPPLLFKPYYLLGRAYFEARLHSSALVHLDEAILLSPDLAKPRYFKGHTLLAMGKNQEALEAFDAAMERNPDNLALKQQLREIRQDLGL